MEKGGSAIERSSRSPIRLNVPLVFPERAAINWAIEPPGKSIVMEFGRLATWAGLGASGAGAGFDSAPWMIGRAARSRARRRGEARRVFMGGSAIDTRRAGESFVE